MRVRLVAIATVVPLITGCASVPTIHCPPLVQYTDLQKKVLGNELDTDGPESIVQLEDYVKLRQACSAP